jgi:hypothetical protein
MEEPWPVRTLVLEIEGSAGRAALLLSGRFPDVARESSGLRLSIGAARTPESVLAFCRERGIGVRASTVRLLAADAAPPDASASPTIWEAEP